MSDKRSSQQIDREKPDPLESDRPWPLYVWIFVMLMVSWGTTYFALFAGDGAVRGGDQRLVVNEKNEKSAEKSLGSNKDTEVLLEDRIAAGKKVYSSICMSCHQTNGQGLPGAFPPLAKSPWVLGTPERIVKLILHGLNGELEILGQKYNGVMPSYKNQFNNQQIANVVTYIRNTWGNKASEIDADFVIKIREEYKDKTDAWKVEDLENE